MFDTLSERSVATVPVPMNLLIRHNLDSYRSEKLPLHGVGSAQSKQTLSRRDAVGSLRFSPEAERQNA